ncbi:MAG: cupin domain-containing protein [Catenulispora sp.]
MTVDEGDRIRVGDVSGWIRTDADAPFNIIEFTLSPAGPPSPRHVHSRIYEANYVLRGEVLARIGEQAEVLAAGSFIRIRPGTPHSVVAHGAPAVILALHSPGADALKMFQTLGRAFDERPSPEELAKHIAGLDIRFVRETG